MTPRVRTISLETNDRAVVVLEAARTSGHSRFPVLDQDDNVVGTVHVKHAVALPPSERHTTRIKHLMVKPILVPDTLRLDPLLALLREDGFQMAVVLDEYGGQAGIVTLEDVVEEIVGDIADEHDPSSAQARQLRDGSWSLSGLLRPDEVADLTDVELPEDENYDTIAGLVLQALGKVPAVGDMVEVWVPDRAYDATHETNDPGRRLAVLTVTHMDGLRIDRVALKLLTDDRAATDGGEHG
jgi:CBS domain containing-hemolysin-like protein